MASPATPFPSGRQPLLYGVEDAAEMLGIGRTSTYSLIRSGRLRTVRVGRRTLVAYDELVRFVAAASAGVER